MTQGIKRGIKETRI